MSDPPPTPSPALSAEFTTPSTSSLYGCLFDGRPQHRPWALVEARVSTLNYQLLLAWAKSISGWDFDQQTRQTPHQIGAVLLWLECEVARRHGDDGGLWEVLGNREIVPWQLSTWERLFTHGPYPRELHKKLISDAALSLELRHAFDVEDSHKWYRLLHLQFGFTHADAKQRLSAWLSGQVSPVSVQTLLVGTDTGAREFQKLWRSLRQFRLGNLSLVAVNRRLKESRWVLPEWCDDLICAAQSSTVFSYEDDDDDAAPDAFFTAPCLRWPARGEPWFEIELCGLDALGLTRAAYELRQRNVTLARLLRQDDDSYVCDVEGGIVIALGASARPQVDLNLVSSEGEIARHSSVCVWDADRDVCLFRPSDGLRVDEFNLRNGQAFYAITPGDVNLVPPASQTIDFGQGYRLHRFEKGWDTIIEARLDNLVLWSSTSFGDTPLALPEDVVTAKWAGHAILDFRDAQQVNRPAPWQVPLAVNVIDPSWRIRGVRWTRADGHLMRWSTAPSALSLVEQDVVKPVVLRVTVTNSGRTVTVPLSLRVPLIGCFRWQSNGRPSYRNANRPLPLADARRSLWSIYLPQLRDNYEVPFDADPRECSLLEGDCVRGRLRNRAAAMPTLAGYGAPAYVSSDPFNSEGRMLDVASSVFDGGVLGNVTFDEQQRASAQRWGQFELGEDHQLVAWLTSATEAGRVVVIDFKSRVTTESGWEFPVPAGWWIAALVLTWRGERIGGWFDGSRWSKTMLRPGVAEPKTVAAMLRSWKAPVLQSIGDSDHFQRVVVWLREHWLIALPIWLSPEGSEAEGAVSVMPKFDEHWCEAVNTLLCEAQPRPGAADVMPFITELTIRLSIDQVEQRLGYAIMELLQFCPLLTARTLAVCLEHHQRLLSRRGASLVGQFVGFFPANEAKADALARSHGNRDGNWLRSTIPTLRELDARTRTLSSAYRKLVKNAEYRKFALGVWVRELQLTFHI